MKTFTSLMHIIQTQERNETNMKQHRKREKIKSLSAGKIHQKIQYILGTMRSLM